MISDVIAALKPAASVAFQGGCWKYSGGDGLLYGAFEKYWVRSVSSMAWKLRASPVSFSSPAVRTARPFQVPAGAPVSKRRILSNTAAEVAAVRVEIRP